MEYFKSFQNMTEILLYSIIAWFFFIEYRDLDKDDRSQGYQATLLGWCLFLAWINVTIILGRFDLFGKNIYLTWNIVKSIFWPIVVYLPTLMAFAVAFHCFLCRNAIFEGKVSSIIRVFTMMIGEYDFEGNFLFDNVAGSKISVQVTCQIHIYVNLLRGLVRTGAKGARHP